ncbi:MAG: rod shape-determining protein MreC [Elusimicrobia bacterium]|jgi:rod shape-determining protein MreC|nr:rod shape-determining protein MreC [Elusimicrobiota bacterium]
MDQKKDTIVLASLLLLSILLLVLNSFDSVKLIKNIGLRFLSPIGHSVEYSGKKSGKLYKKVMSLTNLIEKNEKLRKENENLKKEYRDLNFLNKLHNELVADLNIEDFNPGELMAAEILYHPPDDYFSELIISAGASSDIVKDMAVIGIKDGRWVLQGRIDEVLEDYSKVRLITSPEFKAAAEFSGGKRGIIQGNNGWELTLKYIAPNVILKKGDEVYSSGNGDILPEGLYIGRINNTKKLDFSTGQEAEVELSEYPHNFRYLYVVK